MKAPPVLVTGVAGYAGGGWVAVLPPRGIRAQGTGEALRGSGVPVTELRAGVVVGAGSPSFEMNGWLTKRVPLMDCPRWVFTRAQPIVLMLDRSMIAH